MVSVAWHSLAMPALAHPDGARSGGGPSPHLASASGDLNGRTDGRGRGDVTPQPGETSADAKARIPRRPVPSLVSAFTPSSDSPCGSGHQTSGPHLLRHPSLSMARAFEARTPCWNLRGSQHPSKERTRSVVLLHAPATPAHVPQQRGARACRRLNRTRRARSFSCITLLILQDGRPPPYCGLFYREAK